MTGLTSPKPAFDRLLGRWFSSFWVLFGLGLALSLVMVARSQLGGDQLDMLARGWLFARGDWLHYGMTTSADGKTPGGLVSLLAGAPLLLWHDYRAPALLIALAHAGAFLLLDRVVRRALSANERLLFALLYWLGPWRLFFSAFIWNANWMPVFGALHLWTAWRLRERPGFGLSLLHVLVLAAAFQVHTTFAVLVLVSVALLAVRAISFDWGGVAVGAVLGAVALVPWVEEVVANPALLPGSKGFPFRGLVLVFPLVRGVLFWGRYASLSLAGRMSEYDFTALLGPGIDRWLAPAAHWAALAVGAASVALPLLANVWLARRAWRLRRGIAPPRSGRAWLLRYVTAAAAAALVSFAISPTTVMMWQGFAVMHAAVLAIVLWLGVVLRTPHRALVRRLAPLWLLASVALLLAAAAGAPLYRRGGRGSVGFPQQHDHPMFHQLGVLERTGVTVDPASDWMPDVFRPDPATGR